MVSERDRRYIRMYCEKLTVAELNTRLKLRADSVRYWRNRFTNKIKVPYVGKLGVDTYQVQEELYAIIHCCNSKSMMESAKERVKHLNAILGGKYI